MELNEYQKTQLYLLNHVIPSEYRERTKFDYEIVDNVFNITFCNHKNQVLREQIMVNEDHIVSRQQLKDTVFPDTYSLVDASYVAYKHKRLFLYYLLGPVGEILQPNFKSIYGLFDTNINTDIFYWMKIDGNFGVMQYNLCIECEPHREKKEDFMYECQFKLKKSGMSLGLEEGEVLVDFRFVGVDELIDKLTERKEEIFNMIGVPMKDRDIALGYQKVKDGSAYETYDKAYSELKKQDFGKVLCVNDNFGLNSLIKKYHDCEQYDTVVLNGTHQRYCFNVFPELLVDNFLLELPEPDGYDTVVIDAANIPEETFNKMGNQLCTVVLVKDGEISVKPRVRGQRLNDVIVDDYPFEDKAGEAFYEDGVKTEVDGIQPEDNTKTEVDGLQHEAEDTESDFISEEEAQELRDKLVDDDTQGAD